VTISARNIGRTEQMIRLFLSQAHWSTTYKRVWWATSGRDERT